MQLFKIYIYVLEIAWNSLVKLANILLQNDYKLFFYNLGELWLLTSHRELQWTTEAVENRILKQNII